MDPRVREGDGMSRGALPKLSRTALRVLGNVGLLPNRLLQPTRMRGLNQSCLFRRDRPHLLHGIDACLDEFGEYRFIDVRQFVDVDTAAVRLVFAELLQEFLALRAVVRSGI